MYRYIAAAIMLQLNFCAVAQVKPLPAEARPFVLKGYGMLDYVTGDLNGDQKPDAILILKVVDEETNTADDLKRPFIILTRQANGKLKQEKRNDELVMCRQCGGVFGDPYDNTSITKNGFSIDFYGGSNWRWGYTFNFTWKPAKSNWYLVNEKQISFQATDPESSTKEVNIAEDELGEVAVDTYKATAGGEYGKWKINGAKSFFYDNPKLGSKPRKAYLLKGDMVSVTRLLTNFAEVSFENDKGQFSYGYVLKKDLVKAD